MDKIRLGRTGLNLKRLGLGGIPIQRVSEEDAAKMVVYGIEKGIDFIDTSRFLKHYIAVKYGDPRN